MARFPPLRDSKPWRRPGELPPPRDRAGGLSPRRRHPVLSDDPLHQHDSREPPAGVPRKPRDRAADQEHRPLERDGDGRPGQPRGQEHRRAHLDVRVVGHARRCRDEPLHPRPERRLFRRPGLLSGARLPGHLLAGVRGGTDFREAARELPPRACCGRRPLELPAPLAHAGILGISDGVDGARADHGDLPGPVQQVPPGPWHQGHEPSARLVLHRRRRNRRAGDARRDHPRVP